MFISRRKSGDGEVRIFLKSVFHFVDKEDLRACATLHEVSRFINPWIKNFYLSILKHMHVKFYRKQVGFFK